MIFSKIFRKNYQYSEKQRKFVKIKGLENQEELEDYIDVERKILKAVGDYCHRELQSVGIKGIQSEGGYYYMPDFEICRAGFAKKGIGGFHLHILVLLFVYQFHSRIKALVCSSFANDQFRRISVS